MSDSSVWEIFVIGAHLKGFPLNYQLTELQGELVSTAKTEPIYRLYDLGTEPAKPGMVQVGDEGARIEGEIWRLPLANTGSFIRNIPSPLCIGSIKIHGRGFVQGFLCEEFGTVGARDITEYGSWCRWRKSLET